jgi:hypothetical protein
VDGGGGRETGVQRAGDKIERVNMEESNGIVSKIDAALRDKETPRWAIPMLLCIRDDHQALHEHLRAHRRWSDPIRQIAVSVVTALMVVLTLWVAAGRLPQIFGS